MMLGIHSCRYLSLLSLLIFFLHDITKNIRMQQYSYKNIDDKKSLQMLTYHSFETTGNMHNVHIYKKKKEISIDFHYFF